MEGMTELQALHNMREILNERAAIKKYNDKINKQWDDAALSKTQKEGDESRAAEHAYKKNLKVQEWVVDIAHQLLSPVCMLILIIITNIIARALSGDDPMSGSRVIYGLTAYFIICLIIGVYDDYMELSAIGSMLVGAFCLIMYFASIANLTFWTFLLGIVLFAVWPIAFFFFLETGWVLLIAVVAVGGCIALSLYAADNCFDPEAAAEKNRRIKKFKAEFDRKYSIWCTEYNKARSELSSTYEPKFLKDETENAIQKYNEYLPKEDRTLQTVTNLIWCIERRYANTIVEARQFLYLKSQVAQYQSEMRAAQKRQEELQQQLIREHEESQRRIEKAIDAANKEQLAQMKEQNDHLKELERQGKTKIEELQDISRTAKSIESEARGIATSASTAAREAHDAHDYVRRNI